MVHAMVVDEPPMAKVAFPIDADGGMEWLWCEAVEHPGGPCGRVRNVPLHVRCVELGDIVRVRFELIEGSDEGYVVFTGDVVEPSGHVHLVVSCSDPAEFAQLERLRERFDASMEGFDGIQFALSIQPEVPIEDVLALLDEGSRAGRWRYSRATPLDP